MVGSSEKKVKPLVEYDSTKSREISKEILDFIVENHFDDRLEVIIALDELSHFMALSCNVEISQEEREKRKERMLDFIGQMDIELENLRTMYA